MKYLFLAIFLTSCAIEGPTGPAGPQGEDGSNMKVQTLIGTVSEDNYPDDYDYFLAIFISGQQEPVILGLEIENLNGFYANVVHSALVKADHPSGIVGHYLLTQDASKNYLLANYKIKYTF